MHDVAVFAVMLNQPNLFGEALMNKDQQAAQDPIRLELGATADPRTCGSCVHFERREPWNGGTGGYCVICLPPHVAQKPFDPEGRPPNWVSDANSCSFYKHTGKAYIVSQVIKP